MRIDDPVALARGARTELQAARALASIEAEVSLGERDETWYGEADEALAQLHTRWPRAHLRDAYRHPPTLSPAARRRGDPDRPEVSRVDTGRSRGRVRRLIRDLALLAALAFLVRRARAHPLGALVIVGAPVLALVGVFVVRPSLLAVPVLAVLAVILLSRSGRRRRHVVAGSGRLLTRRSGLRAPAAVSTSEFRVARVGRRRPRGGA